MEADEVRIFERALTENEVERIYDRTKPSSMTGSDLRTGIWESEMMQKVNNLGFGVSIGSGEDLYGNIGTDEDSDETIDDTTGWVLLGNKGGVWEDPQVSDGHRSQVEFKLETDTVYEYKTFREVGMAECLLFNVGRWYKPEFGGSRVPAYYRSDVSRLGSLSDPDFSQFGFVDRLYYEAEIVGEPSDNAVSGDYTSEGMLDYGYDKWHFLGSYFGSLEEIGKYTLKVGVYGWN